MGVTLNHYLKLECIRGDNAMDTNKKSGIKMRYIILGLVFINIIINYMDRTNVSIAMPEISKELDLTTVQQGFIFSAFGWIYAAMQVPGGIVLDKFGPRVTYFFSLLGWSIITVVQAGIHSFSQLLGLRLGVGFFESPVMTANNKSISAWFPEDERGIAIGIYSSAQFLGLAFSMPILYAIHNTIGWRGLFIVTGIIGIVWAFVWYIIYTNPSKNKWISRFELEYIRKNGAILDEEVINTNRKSRLTKESLKKLFTKKLIGIYIGQFAISGTFWFFLTWFPSYLTEEKGISLSKTGFLASVPYIAAFVGVILAGYTTDKLSKKGFSKNTARKLPVIVGLLLTLMIVGANYTTNPYIVILFMSIAFFGNGLATITWVFVTLLSPPELLGLAGGIFNLCGALSSIVIPIIIGFLVSSGSYSSSIVFIASIALLGALSYLLIVGKVNE